MELSIIRRETAGARTYPSSQFTSVPRTSLCVAPNQYSENDAVTKFEIMDGAPIRGMSNHPNQMQAKPLTSNHPGETIPIRLFLTGLNLTPSFRDINKKFSTRYYLNLVITDEENRRYYKQQEITLYRIQGADERPPASS